MKERMLLGKSLSNCIVNVVVILTLLVLIFNIEPLEATRDLHVMKYKLMKVLVSQERAPTSPSTPDPCSYIPGGSNGDCHNWRKWSSTSCGVVRELWIKSRSFSVVIMKLLWKRQNIFTRVYYCTLFYVIVTHIIKLRDSISARFMKSSQSNNTLFMSFSHDESPSSPPYSNWQTWSFFSLNPQDI